MENVSVRRKPVQLPTYRPAAADKNPMFLEKRVYQGSSGRVYPLPFIDRISETKEDVEWDAVHLENEYIYAMILPQLGGRIHILRDKTNGYDTIYNQPVIKPALVGLAGPWISGGIEFNWPQHHRPSTFMPADVEIERHANGSVTVWLSEHDPMSRMKGMHGVCLHPACACLELKARVYNRTPLTQTFLWWANVATRVHEAYQSFFPPDAHYIFDHAKRAMSEFPLCQGHYYGVDYRTRAKKGVSAAEIPTQFVPPHCLPSNSSEHLPDYPPNDLSWYANIPVPTSYMCMGTKEDFFGGYDYKAQAGLVHIANHHISPGKKQWTWGNHEFGYAWDRNLTDPDATGKYAPYIELMAGVYTDNQPDFSFLQPGETKTWSQYWYPIQKIGAAQQANLEAALSLRQLDDRVRLGISTTRVFDGARVVLTRGNKVVFEQTVNLAPGSPFIHEVSTGRDVAKTSWQLSVLSQTGRTIIHYASAPFQKTAPPTPATEPPLPAEITSSDELYVTGLHLEQYRHATRCPSLYWNEALRRDPGDARCNNAMGLWRLRRGEFIEAEKHFRAAIARLTLRNPNPSDGEPHYNLGFCLRHMGRDDEAYDAFYKAVWSQAWQAAGYHALAEIDCTRGDWSKALDHLNRSLRYNADNLRARNLKALILRRLNLADEANLLLKETARLDPLDTWARDLRGEARPSDTQHALDLAHDYARAGFYAEAVELLAKKTPSPTPGAGPLVHYTLGWLHEKSGDSSAGKAARVAAKKALPDYCFPSRLEEIAVLESAIAADARDARAPYYLGNLLYDRRRHREAIARWEQAVRLEPGNAVAWRNLGIGYYNIIGSSAKARAAYEHAVKANPTDARLYYERDQLWKRLCVVPQKRLALLEKNPGIVRQRDDLTIELCALYNQVGRHEDARRLLESRRFQPWEGGEGQSLGQHVRTHLALGREALAAGDSGKARAHFEKALVAPENLGEAKHLLANQSDIHYWLGCACAAQGDKVSARAHWTKSATFKGDFQEMSIRAFSEMTYYSACSWKELGQKTRGQKLLRELLTYAKRLEKAPAKIDYFATSLPTMLLFDEDLQARQTFTARFMQAQAFVGLGRKAEARSLLMSLLKSDPNHTVARDFIGFL